MAGGRTVVIMAALAMDTHTVVLGMAIHTAMVVLGTASHMAMAVIRSSGMAATVMGSMAANLPAIL